MTVAPYDGSADGSGIVQITATGTVSICQGCSITVAGRGPAGGTGGVACHVTCTPSSTGSAGLGVGGGAGGASATIEGGTGGGGGHAASGQQGVVPPYNASTASLIAGPAAGGHAYGSATMAASDVSMNGMGSGGGGGGGCNCPAGANGGAGGGLVRIVANAISVSGTIDASGGTGQSTQNVTSSTPVAGPGGGGSGGSIWLSAETVTMQPTGVLQTQGGQGGQGTSTPLEGVTVGGNGSAGYVRIDSAYYSNSGGSITGTTYQSVYHRYTDYSYNADNHLIDTVQGADNPIAAQAGKPSADGGQNVRTRTLYDPEGHVSERFDPRAFTASVTSPDLSFMVRTDYDYDERPATQWVPRYDNGAHADIGVINTQTTQCPTGADPSVYPSTIGLCVTRVAYDYNGNVTFERLPTSTSSGDNRYVIDSYTNDNLVSSVSAPNPASNGSQETVQSNVYDGDGKLVRQTDALGEQRLTAYTPDELVQSVTNQANGALTHVTSFAYDANGNQLTATDGSGNVTTTAYYSDNLRSDSTDGAGDHTSYAYDPNGNATTVTSPSANAGDPNNTAHAPTLNTYTFDNLLQSTTVPFAANDSTAYTTTYSYDDGGRKTSQHVALLNTSNGSLNTDGGTQSFNYYNDDRLVQQTGRDGSTITSQYDPAGNLASATSGGSTISATYYLDGLPRTVDDGSQTTRFGYDGLGSVSARYQLADNGSNPIGTDYVYGDAERVTQMAWGGVLTNSTFYSYDADGRPTTETMPNGEQLSWVFNPDNTLQQQTLSSAATGGTTLAQYTYAYNADYLVTQQQFSHGTTGLNAYTNTLCYGYDAANRINSTSAPAAGSACGSVTPSSVTWDHDGNRLSYTTPGSNSQILGFTYNADNSIATSASGSNSYSSSYTGAGETSNDGCLTYSYDGFSRVTQATPTPGAQGCTGVSGASYTYDALDRRVMQSDATPNTTTIHYDGLGQNNVALESSTTSGNVSYELDPSGSAQGLTSSQGVQYLTSDGHGSLTTATGNASAAVTCAVRYDAFGAPINATAADPCNAGSTLDDLLFKGTRRDSATGQYQFGSRVYDPTKATFLTPDTYRSGTPTANPSVGVDPLTANTYVGLNGDPVNLSDPSGHRYTTGDDQADANSGVLCQTCYTYPTHYPSGTSRTEIVGDRAMAVYRDTAIGNYLDWLDQRATFMGMHVANELRHQFDGDPYDVGFFSSCHWEYGLDVCPNSQGDYALTGEDLVLERLQPLNLADVAIHAGALFGFAACSAGTGFVGTVACGAAAAAADSAVQQFVDTGSINPAQVGVSAVVGSVSVAGIGAASRFASRLFSGYATDAAGEVSDLAPAVIGRGMNARVIPYAQENGYVWYEGCPECSTEAERLADNGARIQGWMAEGRQIIDIGPGGMSSVSRAYNLEHDLIFGSGYENYVIHDLGDITDEAVEATGGG